MNTKPFDLKAAKAGAKVVNKKGNAVEIVDYHADESDGYPLKAIVHYKGRKLWRQFAKNGRYNFIAKDDFDLLMAVDEQGNYIYEQT